MSNEKYYLGAGRKKNIPPGKMRWWAVQGSNLRPPVCKTDTLPLS